MRLKVSILNSLVAVSKKKKKKKNRCKSISKKSKKKYFKNITKGGFMNNKKFWSTAKSFLTNKAVFGEDQTGINVENDIINGKKCLVEFFNENHISIVQATSGKKITTLGDPSNL